jgi:hypothetical protein
LGRALKEGAPGPDYHDFRLFYETEDDTSGARQLRIGAALTFLDYMIIHGTDQDVRDAAAGARLLLKQAKE